MTHMFAFFHHYVACWWIWVLISESVWHHGIKSICHQYCEVKTNSEIVTAYLYFCFNYCASNSFSMLAGRTGVVKPSVGCWGYSFVRLIQLGGWGIKRQSSKIRLSCIEQFYVFFMNQSITDAVSAFRMSTETFSSRESIREGEIHTLNWSNSKHHWLE